MPISSLERLGVELFDRCRSGFVDDHGAGRASDRKPHLIDDGGTDVPSMLVLRSNVFRNSFEAQHKIVGLLVVGAIEYCPVQFLAISLKFGRKGLGSGLRSP